MASKNIDTLKGNKQRKETCRTIGPISEWIGICGTERKASCPNGDVSTSVGHRLQIFGRDEVALQRRAHHGTDGHGHDPRRRRRQKDPQLGQRPRLQGFLQPAQFVLRGELWLGIST